MNAVRETVFVDRLLPTAKPRLRPSRPRQRR